MEKKRCDQDLCTPCTWSCGCLGVCVEKTDQNSGQIYTTCTVYTQIENTYVCKHINKYIYIYDIIDVYIYILHRLGILRYSYIMLCIYIYIIIGMCLHRISMPVLWFYQSRKFRFCPPSTSHCLPALPSTLSKPEGASSHQLNSASGGPQMPSEAAWELSFLRISSGILKATCGVPAQRGLPLNLLDPVAGIFKTQESRQNNELELQEIWYFGMQCYLQTYEQQIPNVDTPHATCD